jgi:hypothetical protein
MLHKKNFEQIKALGTVLLLFAVIAGCRDNGKTVTIPENTSVVVALNNRLSTQTATEGQSFRAETTEPIVINGNTVVPSGTAVRGYVNEVKKPGKVNGGAELTLEFRDIVTNSGETYGFDTAPITLTAKSDADADVERIAGSTIAGAIIGGIVKGGKGAAVGAVVGAGAGGTWAIATRGDQIVLEPGQKFRIQTTETTELPVLASK